MNPILFSFFPVVLELPLDHLSCSGNLSHPKLGLQTPPESGRGTRVALSKPSATPSVPLSLYNQLESAPEQICSAPLSLERFSVLLEHLRQQTEPELNIPSIQRLAHTLFKSVCFCLCQAETPLGPKNHQAPQKQFHCSSLITSSGE